MRIGFHFGSQRIAGQWGTFRAGAPGEVYDVVTFQYLLNRHDYMGRKGRLRLERRPPILDIIELQLMDFVEEEPRPGQIDRVLQAQLPDDFRGLEKPVAIVFRAVDVVGEILRYAAAD